MSLHRLELGPHLLRSAADCGLRGAALAAAACPASPDPDPKCVRPEQVVDFPTLYNQNCAACHGENGKNGAAISLANPVYIALAGEDSHAQTQSPMALPAS